MQLDFTGCLILLGLIILGIHQPVLAIIIIFFLVLNA